MDRRHFIPLTALAALTLLATAPVPASARARADAAQPGTVAAPPVAPTMGTYHCVLFISGSGLQTVPGFTLSTGKYRHQNGGGGTTRYDAATGIIEFSGGPLAGQAGKVKTNRVNLFNEKRTRTVIDCDTK